MKSLRGMLPSVKILAIGAGAAVAGLGAGLFAIANSTAKAGDEFQKMSLRLGLSTGMLSGMKHAVELSGSSMESLEKGVRTLAKRMSDADEGLTEAERSFTALGIQIKNADGSLKDLDTPEVADRSGDNGRAETWCWIRHRRCGSCGRSLVGHRRRSDPGMVGGRPQPGQRP